MKNSDTIPELSFDEEKINFLLKNAEKLHLVMSKEQIDFLVSSLKENLEKIEETINTLKDQESDTEETEEKNIHE
jgi:chromosomal replication initiation ATPase DnaA